MDAGDASTQEELGRKVGMKQGSISNLIRLLELPEVWQQRIISGEISPTHARASFGTPPFRRW